MAKCPCCGKNTIEELNENCICPECGWEDDWWDSNNPDGFPSSNWVTLNQAREMYAKTGKSILLLEKEGYEKPPLVVR